MVAGGGESEQLAAEEERGVALAAGGDGLLGVLSCALVVAGDECHLCEDEVDGRNDGGREGGDAPGERVELFGDRRGRRLVAEDVGGLGERGHVGEPQLVAADVSVSLLEKAVRIERASSSWPAKA